MSCGGARQFAFLCLLHLSRALQYRIHLLPLVFQRSESRSRRVLGCCLCERCVRIFFLQRAPSVTVVVLSLFFLWHSVGMSNRNLGTVVLQSGL
ncbi:hypothetical protein KC19_VG230300 [Ceratodon purpureus]|uniref:Secreted protein n=1 Tax=Ceratodon purpureus TaxID=3225 RepID=A0A8T0HSX5_CERPU|nr:hypothetical protein KC19_VG230300 [Ceratodon purpureus]